MNVMKLFQYYVWVIILILVFSCKKDPSNSQNTRTYRMGFQNSGPKPDFNLYYNTLKIWEQRADAAMITTEVPWDSLLNGTSPQKYVLTNYKGLVDYYRTKNFKLWVYIDPANGLDRASDATALAARKRSIAQADIQAIYRRFTFVMDSVLQPEHLGLALETNLIRGISPDSIYQGVKKAANDASKEIRAYDTKVKLSVSIQVDYAWGKLDNSAFKPIDQDFADFPFIEELGMSSYPYLAYAKPQDIPLNYYSTFLSSTTLPVFVSEGGWTSASVDKIVSTPEIQRDYILKHAQLLDEVKATAVFQLAFTDIDLQSLTGNIPSNLYVFAALGLVDINLNPKPALAAWDSIFNRRYVGN